MNVRRKFYIRLEGGGTLWTDDRESHLAMIDLIYDEGRKTGRHLIRGWGDVVCSPTACEKFPADCLASVIHR